MRQSTFFQRTEELTSLVQKNGPAQLHGQVLEASGLTVDIVGLSHSLAIGDRLGLTTRAGGVVPAEIVGFEAGVAKAMTFATCLGLGPGARVAMEWRNSTSSLAVSDGWLGRVIDPLGRPLDGKGGLPAGPQALSVRREPPPATQRGRLGPPISFGVRALDIFTTCRLGQRIGLFAGSGVGKSTLLSMLARGADCDVAVLALVGERGREVREFLEDELGAAGLARSVVVVATSDSPPLMRREAAYAAMTVAEKFCDDGKNVLLLMDSVTRFCMALREIGLSTGEPPATRGYPPSVFAELPRLLERAGPGEQRPGGHGSITALFTVLVEGDDQNEPVADAVRGILDGHVVLDRRIAELGRYPAVDVLRSLSRSAPGCNTAGQAALVKQARQVMATFADMADMVRLGAYRAGSDPAIDNALRLAPAIEALLRQSKEEHSDLEACFAQLAKILGPFA